jgi:hypothetical protein
MTAIITDKANYSLQHNAYLKYHNLSKYLAVDQFQKQSNFIMDMTAAHGSICRKIKNNEDWPTEE